MENTQILLYPHELKKKKKSLTQNQYAGCLINKRNKIPHTTNASKNILHNMHYMFNANAVLKLKASQFPQKY